MVYRLLDPAGLAPEIADMRALVEASYRTLTITQDLGLGMMLWMSHFFPDEPWAVIQRTRALAMRTANGCGDWTRSSRRTALTTNTTPMPSRTSWRARPISRDDFFARLGQSASAQQLRTLTRTKV